MSVYPPIAKTQVTRSGVIKTTIARPKAYYSRGSSQRLPAGQITVHVTFTTPLRDASWVFGGMTIWNNGDAAIDLQFIQIIGVSAKSQSGFDLLLSTPPMTDNYWLDWTIAESTNP